MRLPLALTTALLGALGALAFPAGAQARAWTLADTAGGEYVDDVRLSPDGAFALIEVVRGDLGHDTFVNRYLRVRIADGATTPLPDGLSHPRWRPGGATIAWLRSSRDGASQIVLSDARGGSIRALTHSPRSVIAFTWSPDGRRIAAIETAPVKGAKPARITWMTAETDYRATAPPSRMPYVVDVANGAEQRLTHDTWSYGGPVTDHDPSWSADGTRIAVVRQPTPVYGDFEHAQDVTIELATGAIRQIVNGAFFAYPGSPPPAFAPSGDAIAYARTWDGLLPSREDVFVGDRDVSAGIDRDLWSCGAGSAEWNRGGLVVDLLDGVSMRLYRLDPAGGAPRPITGTGGSAGTFSVAPTGRIAYVWSTPSSEPELYVLDPGGAPRQLTHLSALHGLPIATTRYVEWTVSDGHVLHGQLTVPDAVNLHDVPLVVEPHGGPQCADDASFSPLAQFLASNGYAYFRPDPRGSDGYGDWSYKAIVGNFGEGPMSDDMAGVDSVLASGVSHAGDLFIEGGSYGGYLTTWITTHSDRFRAAVAAVPLTNLLLEYTLSESPNILRRFFGAKPSLDPALLDRESPLTYAANEHTPLLVQIGLRDTRAPYAQGIEFYKTVAEHGDEAKLFADADAGHGPDDPKGAVLWLQATMAWLTAHGAPAIPGIAPTR
jgi:dipeptidyl aminopeptidase/acylaminoacyl peptidase